ncbi:RNA-binding protein RO60-like [Saccostrea cucullata]|uniref:RNA-binding protein RO60-like n=1 Tax=Saccostrea cuccullata TaxID=36930 RepID=UPI002ECFB770
MSDDEVMEIEEDEWAGLSMPEGPEVPVSGKLAPYQTVNNTEGYVFKTDYETRLRRFLCIGTDGGTYYTGEKDLTRENAESIVRMINNGNGLKVVETIREFSVENKACKANPIMFALALSCRSNDPTTKEAGYKILSDVCRIPTHLFQFIKFCQEINPYGKGWGRAHRKGVSTWYQNYKQKNEGILMLAHHVTKYKARFGFSHQDVFRLCHIKTIDDALGYLVSYICRGKAATESQWKNSWAMRDEGFQQSELKKVIDLLKVFEDAQKCTNEELMKRMILEHHLAREHVPTGLLKSKEVWGALMRHMPMTAMIRNLGKMSSLGLLESDSFGEQITTEKLKNEQLLKGARIHPFTVLVAIKAYAKGKGELGKLEWPVNRRVVDALQEAFYLSFKCLKPTGKRFLLAVDVSGSMNVPVMGTPIITARDAAAAMMMVTVRTEQNYDVVAFSGGGNSLTKLAISPQDNLTAVLEKCSRLRFAHTDCSAPIVDAIQNKKLYDVFVVYTDSETNYGSVHPSKALKNYRHISGIKDARLIVCGMASNGFTIADPEDPCMMDIVGFDSGAPVAIHQFVTGTI